MKLYENILACGDAVVHLHICSFNVCIRHASGCSYSFEDTGLESSLDKCSSNIDEQYSAEMPWKFPILTATADDQDTGLAYDLGLPEYATENGDLRELPEEHREWGDPIVIKPEPETDLDYGENSYATSNNIKQVKEAIVAHSLSSVLHGEYGPESDMNFQGLATPKQEEATSNTASRPVNPASFFCQLCNKGFVKYINYQKHMIRYHKDGECHLCKASLRDGHELNEHLVECHPNDRDKWVPCDINKQRPMACPLCPKSFNNIVELKKHLSVHTGIRPYPCQSCGKSYYDKKRLQLHVAQEHPELEVKAPSVELYGCSECGRQFTNKWERNKHVMIHSNKKPYSCEQCGKCFTRPDYVRAHTQAVHAKNGTFPCYICGSVFSYRETLRIHLLKHDPEREFSCKHCTAAFTVRYELQLHLHVAHSDKKRSRLTPAERKEMGKKKLCLVCGDVLANKVSLWHHNRRMRRECNFACSQCEKRFESKRDLKVHVRIHTGEKPFRCEICSKTYRQRGHLTVHMRTHTGVKPYKCQQCEKSFTVKSGLDKHMLLHARRQNIMVTADLTEGSDQLVEHVEGDDEPDYTNSPAISSDKPEEGDENVDAAFEEDASSCSPSDNSPDNNSSSKAATVSTGEAC